MKTTLKTAARLLSAILATALVASLTPTPANAAATQFRENRSSITGGTSSHGMLRTAALTKTDTSSMYFRNKFLSFSGAGANYVQVRGLGWKSGDSNGGYSDQSKGIWIYNIYAGVTARMLSYAKESGKTHGAIGINFMGVGSHYLEFDWTVNTTTCPYSIPTTNLQQGSTGNGVKWVQWNLNRKNFGYPLVVDGIFGIGTAEQVGTFQYFNYARHGLNHDRIVGPATRNVLNIGN